MLLPKYLLLGMYVSFEAIKPEFHGLRVNPQQSCPYRSYARNQLIRKRLVSDRSLLEVTWVCLHWTVCLNRTSTPRWSVNRPAKLIGALGKGLRSGGPFPIARPAGRPRCPSLTPHNQLRWSEKMNALEKNIAVARGEALAANLLATAAIHTALSVAANQEEVLARMNAFIEDTLNMSGPGRGHANDEFNTQMRETARFMAMQTLDQDPTSDSAGQGVVSCLSARHPDTPHSQLYLTGRISAPRISALDGDRLRPPF